MDAQYNVILADPPWWYADRKNGGNKTKFGGGAQKHYPLMRDSELLSLAPFVQNLTTENAALFLWTTMPRLDFAVSLLKAWGFRYATTAFVWVKPSIGGRWHNGPGYYTASNAEVVILGVKGRMKPVRTMLDSVVCVPKTRHSEKPSEVRKRIEQMYPTGRKIELFARARFDGWDAWGNELEQAKPRQ